MLSGQRQFHRSAVLPHHHSDALRLISEGPLAKATLLCSRREAKCSIISSREWQKFTNEKMLCVPLGEHASQNLQQWIVCMIYTEIKNVLIQPSGLSVLNYLDWFASALKNVCFVPALHYLWKVSPADWVFFPSFSSFGIIAAGFIAQRQDINRCGFYEGSYASLFFPSPVPGKGGTNRFWIFRGSMEGTKWYFHGCKT